MTKIRTYQCPGTVAHPPHQFSHLHHPSVALSPVPRFCPTCGFDSEAEDYTPALTSPHIAKTIGRAVDDTHKAMEEGANFRAEISRERFGLDAAEANAIKSTDSADYLRPGDTSDAPVNNPITQVMQASPPGMFGFQGAAGLGYSGAVAEGPNPNAGARAQNALRQHHAQSMANSGHVGATTSNLPALETVAPGYRRRV